MRQQGPHSWIATAYTPNSAPKTILFPKLVISSFFYCLIQWHGPLLHIHWGDAQLVTGDPNTLLSPRPRLTILVTAYQLCQSGCSGPQPAKLSILLCCQHLSQFLLKSMEKYVSDLTYLYLANHISSQRLLRLHNATMLQILEGLNSYLTIMYLSSCRQSNSEQYAERRSACQG